jgi:hypothetical protein
METFTESLILTLTPSLKQRLQDFADEQNWHVTAAIRYFIQDGLDRCPFTGCRELVSADGGQWR